MKKIRINEARFRAFEKELLARRDVETAGVLLARSMGNDLFVVEDLLLVPDDGYDIREPDRLRIKPVTLNRLWRRARDEGLSVFTIHTHPLSTEAWFSLADDAGDSRLMPSLHVQMPHRSHGSIVLAGSGALVARAFDKQGEVARVVMSVVGRQIRQHDVEPVAPNDAFARQELALGTTGLHRLRRLRVGVVGLGGTGSVVAAQLAHLGVGELVLLDGDVVTTSNLSRIIGATRNDVDVTPKVSVAERYALAVGLTSVTAIGEYLTDENVRALRDCDVIFSCVDQHTPRALMNALAYDALVPVIDLGSAFRVDGTGAITSEAGRVVVVGPGRPCFACWGHLDPERMRIESLSPDARAAEAALGYVQGADVPEPSVIAFNTLLAGAAVVEFLRITTGFAGAANGPDRLAFSFTRGEARRNTLPPSDCSICGRTSAPIAGAAAHE